MSENIAKEIDFGRGIKGQIIYDTEPPNPRTDWDNLGTMICFHGRYNLGDKDNTYKSDDYDGWESLKAQIERDHGPCVFRNIFLYDHSGLTVSSSPYSCPWDSGQVGLIFVSHAKLRHEQGWKKVSQKRRMKASDWLEGEIKTYDEFLRGDVYGLILEEDGEETDSCWGYYGFDYAEEEIRMWAKVAMEALPKFLPGFEPKQEAIGAAS